MFVLINRDEMDLVAKHPNWAALLQLGIIACPDATEVIPFDENVFKDFVDSELEMLYIAITVEAPDPSWCRDDLEYLLMYLINECKESLIDSRDVALQAQYVIDWDLEGYCSYEKGKKEPSMDAGKWDNLTVDFDIGKAAIVLATKSPIVFKQQLQRSFERKTEAAGNNE